ncbi:nitrate ABC transporter substrate-binding protein [Brucella cytisi]|jgi:4,5-dihydroxyphthalate decarboxylase|uniref:nitrate ABC transporter substrate-binding protein n=1 Tax=Brucella cytisi TaxID=407152 RepID=UPI0035DA5B19
MSITLRLAVRDWDYLTPLALGDVRSSRINVILDRVGTLVSHPGLDEAHDAAEMSFSRYASMRFEGDDRIVGIPNFIMRGFRHRCVITRRDCHVRNFADLSGKKIGVTGWRDSGNIWTRAALRLEGVGVDDARWYAGRLTGAHPITDRLDGFGRPGHIEAMPGEKPMMEMLRDGFLDAVFTPFMPDGYFGKEPGFRQLLDDFRGAERTYFDQVGYVPGMHLIGIKPKVLSDNPWVADELSALLDESQRVWTAKRRKYGDTTPWMIDELLKVARDLPENWSESGLTANEAMIDDFAEELHVQGILPRKLTIKELFPFHASGN